MKEKEYNLLDESWIRVIDEDCVIHEVSLLEVFEHAHLYRDLCGELPTQDFAMLRLLLSVLHTVFSRYDINGEEWLPDSPEDALEHWKELWENRRFPIKVIRTYLESQRENFYLFHPERPFYQCEHAKAGTEYGASKLNGNLSESSNKLRLFTDISGKAKEELSFSEAARWLLYVNAYDDTSAKPSRESKEQGSKLPSTGVGWLGKLGIIFVAGKNLFETLMLNLIMADENGELFEKETPVWERAISDGERIQIPFPDNLSALYTLQSRRLYLNRRGQKVTGYFLLGGDFFEKENAFIEPMTVWKRPDRKKPDIYTPRRHDFAKQFWRECPGAILGSEDGRQPGIILWIKDLQEKELVEDSFLDIRIVSVQYGDKDFFVTNVFSDSLQMHASLISDMNVQGRQAVLDSIDFCDTVSQKVWTFAKDINLASGGSDSTKESKGSAAFFAENAKADFYNRIDAPFRRWLSAFDPAVDDVYDKKVEWRQECVGIARKMGNEMIRQAGSAAVFGRAKINPEDRKKNEIFSAAGAMNRFLNALSAAEKS